MTSRRSVVVVEEFYANPMDVRAHALRLDYYTPYECREALAAGTQATWWASRFLPAPDCPFKSSREIVGALECAVGERIDLQHWNNDFPTDADGHPVTSSREANACLWNCCFHVKPDNRQRLGDGVHNHVVDAWNSVGTEGWAGIIYLSPDAPLEGGLHLWRNRNPDNQFDWMTPSDNWEQLDAFGNLFNRLVLVRGNIPHSGAGGWGRRLEDGRLYQTFFFRTRVTAVPWPVGSVELAQ